MKWGWATALLVCVTGVARAEVAVTVYNQNLGLVSEQRTFELKSGMQHLSVTDVAALMVPTSVRISFPGSQVEVHEQNYHYDLVNTQAILQRYLDLPVRLVGKEGAVYEGTLLSSIGSYVLSTPAGLQLFDPGEITRVDLAELPSGFCTRPTLDWLVGTDRPGRVDASLSYLTNGIGWQAEYVAHLNADDSKIDLSGWASIDNQSGATYTDAKLKLIAGDIHRPPAPVFDYMTTASAEEAAPRMKAGFEERSFFEYHLYDLPRRTTLAQRESKQIALFEPAVAAVTKKYLYRSWKVPNKIAVVVDFKNSQTNGLGVPLPAGLVRITKSDVDGSSQLLGEDRIDHTPKDENLTLEVGNAFDLVPEHATVDRRRVSQYVTDSDVKITLRNHKSEKVTVEVEEKASGWRTWSITASSQPYERKDAETFTFKAEIPADGEIEITYTLRTGS
jgi:hypothetical protein